MGQHHALGLAGRAGGVDERGDRIGLRDRGGCCRILDQAQPHSAQSGDVLQHGLMPLHVVA